MWVRRLRSGQEVSYNHLPFQEVVALATALDEWEMILYKKGIIDGNEGSGTTDAEGWSQEVGGGQT